MTVVDTLMDILEEGRHSFLDFQRFRAKESPPAGFRIELTGIPGSKTRDAAGLRILV